MEPKTPEQKSKTASQYRHTESKGRAIPRKNSDRKSHSLLEHESRVPLQQSKSQESMGAHSQKSDVQISKRHFRKNKAPLTGSLESDVSSASGSLSKDGSVLSSNRIAVSFQNLSPSKSHGRSSASEPHVYESYMPLAEVQKGLKKGELIEGVLRINPRKFEDSYIMAPGEEMDIYLDGLLDRNRGLQGDIVVARLKHQTSWKVVYIKEKKHPRVAVGTLKLLRDKNPEWALFSPKDHCIPRMKIPMNQCPTDFFKRSKDYENSLFLARIVAWTHVNFAIGELIRLLGNRGELEVETEGILLQQGIKYENFSSEVLNSLPAIPWSIPSTEFEYRKDLRQTCIFTIDPLTAKDLDDALSCEVLPNGNFKVGVHIADVTFFVLDGSAVDLEASDRGTSVYLVQKVIPMLPPVLSENLCSLNPFEDKLAFSVLWELDSNAEIISEEWTRSIVSSCVKLSYEQAQEMIDTDTTTLNESNFPKMESKFTIKDIGNRVRQLHSLAVVLKEKRIKYGALRLDRSKISFVLDGNRKYPVGFYLAERRESNSLVEEFMLLANQSAAKRIHKYYPRISLLRKHDAPNAKGLREVIKVLIKYGVTIDASSSKQIMASLLKLEDDNSVNRAKKDVIVQMLSKTMKLAQYFCTGHLVDPNLFWHYALSVQFYTHFTSPIRRYPDIIVHRLLASSLKYRQPPAASSVEIQRRAVHCNERKQAARLASEASTELFLTFFIKQMGTYKETGIVIRIMDHCCEVFLPSLTCTSRVYMDALDLDSFEYDKNIPALELRWKAEKVRNNNIQIIKLFTTVQVILNPSFNSLEFSTVIEKPL